MTTSRAEQQRARMTAAAARRAGPDPAPAGITALRTKPLRVPIDLPPELHRRLMVWCDSTAVAIGEPRLSMAKAMRAMIEATLDGSAEVTGAVTDTLRRQSS